MQTQPFRANVEEQLSALVDGELSDAACAAVLGAMDRSAESTEQWNTYHLIGEALRSGQGSASGLRHGHGVDLEFVQRLGHRLSQEKVATADLASAPPAQPQLMLPGTVRNVSLETVGSVNPLFVKDAANDATLRWKMLAGFACMGTVAALAWGVVSSGSADSAAQLAQSTPGALQQQVVVASPQGLVVRDARLQELLAAHKQMGGTSLPVPSGFVRNANFENQPKNPR